MSVPPCRQHSLVLGSCLWHGEEICFVAKEESEIVVRMPGNKPAWVTMLLFCVLPMEALHLAGVHAFREISCSPPYPLNAIGNSCVIVASENTIRESNFPVIYVVVCADWKKHFEFRSLCLLTSRSRADLCCGAAAIPLGWQMEGGGAGICRTSPLAGASGAT